MDAVAIVIMLAIGAVAGWLGGGGFGLLGNILVGIAGAMVAGFLFPGFCRSVEWSGRLSAPRSVQ